MTNRELAKWLSQGKGQFKYGESDSVFISYSYSDDDNAEVPEPIMVRGWNEKEWHEPEVEVW